MNTFVILMMLAVCGEYIVTQTTVQESTCSGDVHMNTQMDRMVVLLESLSQRLQRLEESQGRLEENQFHPYINLALHRPAWQSSNYSSSSKADRAVDGKGGYSCAHTLSESGTMWWAVDLGTQYHVHRLEITGRSDYQLATTWFKDVYIGASDVSPLTRTPDVNNFSRCTFFPGPLALGETRSIGCDSGMVIGRYVIITKTSQKHLSLCEVKVFGYL